MAACFVSFKGEKPSIEQIKADWAAFSGRAQELNLPSAPKQFLHYFDCLLYTSWLTRPLELLPTDGRPMSQANPLAALWETRKALYEQFSDVTVRNDTTINVCVQQIEEALL